jgi:sigma-E factor negative regulatory protein RseA
MKVNEQQADPDGRSAALSAMVDGQLRGDALQQACAAWRDDPAARAQWHTYHLIGDVLRSDDLATPAGHDSAFLTALRGRLANEPVPLAPQALVGDAVVTVSSPAPVRRGQWLVAPVAVAAGFVAVATVLVMVRGTATPEPGAVMADASAPTVATLAAPMQPPGMPLDRYLNAHRKVSNAMNLAMPAGAVRRVDLVVVDAK